MRSQLQYLAIRIPMQEEILPQQKKEASYHETRGRHYFNVKNIDLWQDFRKTWKSVKFDAQLNEMDQAGIEQFWEQHMVQLERETLTVCILVPNQVDKPNANQQKKAKNTKRKPERVKLNSNIIQIAIRLLEKRKDTLCFTYQSLFFGNQRQLLIYRNCNSIERYLEKYRLPKQFKETFDPFLKLSQVIYDLNIKKNIAISTLNDKLTKKLQEQFDELDKQFNQRWQVFKGYFRPILEDFKTKSKPNSIYINGIRGHFYPLLQQLVQNQGLFLTNKFYQTDHDEIRDIVIKKEHFQHLQGNLAEQEPVKQRYIYIQPPKQPEAPKDIYDVQLVKVNTVKKCWIWRVHMPKCSSYNQFKGLYFKAPEDQGTAELTIEVSKGTETIDVELYPYKIGKIVWQIYIWNQIGFTKSAQKLVYYNQFEVSGESEPFKDHTLYFVRASECGVISQEANAMTVKSKHLCKDISIYNATVICDSNGSAAGWGEMYYTDQQEDEVSQTQLLIQENLKTHLRVENPFLIMSGRYIRRVSCGYGFTLMLSSLGSIWSFGFNKYGQLGQGHFKSNIDSIQPRQISRFTGQSGAFIVDICATSKGSSFAIDDNGRLYRWGYNQVQQTHLPIHDRFNTIVNYQTGDVLYKNASPGVVSKNLINGTVVKLEACEDQYFALTKENELYGWGVVKTLGCGVLRDTSQREIEDIVNPISIIRSVQAVSSNIMHTVVLTKAKKVLAWGRASYFSNKLKGFIQNPIDVTSQFGKQSPIKFVKAGRNFTLALREDNKIEIVGSQTTIKLEQQFEHKIVDITCSKYQELFAVFVDQ